MNFTSQLMHTEVTFNQINPLFDFGPIFTQFSQLNQWKAIDDALTHQFNLLARWQVIKVMSAFLYMPKKNQSPLKISHSWVKLFALKLAVIIVSYGNKRWFRRIYGINTQQKSERCHVADEIKRLLEQWLFLFFENEDMNSSESSCDTDYRCTNLKPVI